MINAWKNFSEKHPGIAQFLMFFIVSNGITVLQLVMMPVFKFVFDMTPLVDTNFQLLQVGSNLDGSAFYVFDYARGAIAAGGGGGLAYFLAVQLTLGIAQVINFFVQRNVTFKADNDVKKAAMWYVIAYLVISIAAAALQGVYKVPIYNFCMNQFGEGLGITIADVTTMVINAAISFWVFFPIFKIIFKNEPEKA